MKRESTPEEKEEIRAIHSGFQVAGGFAFVGCAVAGAFLVFGGRKSAPNWIFGGAPTLSASGGRWTNRVSAVDFAEWGAPPFERARREGKLVLFFIGPNYSAATERALSETFADPRVAALASTRFVPVRADSAQWPDLDRRYRLRGWPTILLLTPDGDVVDAGAAMTPENFLRWAGALADIAAEPGRLQRLVSDAASRRREAVADLSRTKSPPTPNQAIGRALQLLLGAWNPQRRTFEAEGPRFPRFERAAALASLKAPWARELAAQMLLGDRLFVNPVDGAARRSAAPDGGVLAREETAETQASALDAFCPAQEDMAHRILAFTSGPFSPKDGPPRYRGSRAGYALTKDLEKATDGADFDAAARDGRRPEWAARLGEEAELARAVLSCRAASALDRARALDVARRVARDFDASARKKDARLLLDDAVGVGDVLVAAGRPQDAERVRRYIEENFSSGLYYWDRRPTGVLPDETDRIADPALNARVLEFLQRLAAALPPGTQRETVQHRAETLLPWLAARADALDPAVWASVIERPSFAN